MLIGLIALVSFFFYGVTKASAKEQAEKGNFSALDRFYIYARSILISAFISGAFGANADKPYVIGNVWALFLISSIAGLVGGREGFELGKADWQKLNHP